MLIYTFLNRNKTTFLHTSYKLYHSKGIVGFLSGSENIKTRPVTWTLAVLPIDKVHFMGTGAACTFIHCQWVNSSNVAVTHISKPKKHSAPNLIVLILSITADRYSLVFLVIKLHNPLSGESILLVSSSPFGANGIELDIGGNDSWAIIVF